MTRKVKEHKSQLPLPIETNEAMTVNQLSQLLKAISACTGYGGFDLHPLLQKCQKGIRRLQCFM